MKRIFFILLLMPLIGVSQSPFTNKYWGNHVDVLGVNGNYKMAFTGNTAADSILTLNRDKISRFYGPIKFFSWTTVTRPTLGVGDAGVHGWNTDSLRDDIWTGSGWIQSPLAGSGGGITSINSLTASALTIGIGTSGTDFNVSTSGGNTITLNMPDASATARGVMTTGSQSIAGAKTYSGAMTVNANLSISAANYLLWTGRSRIYSSADGVLTFVNNGLTDFNRFTGGGTTNAFPSFQRSGVNWIARLADNSANTDVEVLDEAYGIAWDGSNEVPTKNALYDKIQTLGGNTIYTGDGTLSGNRIVSGNNLNLTFDNISDYRINATGVGVAKRNSSFLYTIQSAPSSSDSLLVFAYTPLGIGNYSKGAAMGIDTNNNVVFGSTFSPNLPPNMAGAAVTVKGSVIYGGEYADVATYSTNTTINSLRRYVYINATSGNVTITLPAATDLFGGSAGWVCTFKRIDNSVNTVTIQVAGGSGDLIDGSGSFTLTTMESKTIQAYNTSTFYIH